MQTYQVTTPPAAEPLTLSETKLFLRVDLDTEDSLITRWIKSARVKAENYLRRSLITQTITLTLDRFPRACADLETLKEYLPSQRRQAIEILHGPVQSISSVKFYDGSNVQRTKAADTYVLEKTDDASYLMPAADTEWDTTYERANAVEIVFVGGYGNDGSAVDGPIIDGMLIYIGHLFENRQGSSEIPKIVKDLWNPLRIARF